MRAGLLRVGHPGNPQKLAAWRQTTGGRTFWHLRSFFKRTPDATLADVRGYAAELAAGLGEKPDVLLAAWRRSLQRRNLLPKGGAPPRTKRYQAVAAVRADWERRSNGTFAGGFVKAAWKAAKDAEGKPIDRDTFEKWLYRQTWPD